MVRLLLFVAVSIGCVRSNQGCIHSRTRLLETAEPEMIVLPLPMTVVSGYLGAGKTTLINRLLAEPHGLRLMVVVNDFGAINIDADLLASQKEDTIALTNGCVCCTMGDDLFAALNAILDRNPRPDHIIVEASGVADPVAIANAAISEPELSYAGILTVVDGLNGAELLSDPKISEQVAQQITAGDMVLVSKTEVVPNDLAAAIRNLGARHPRVLDDIPISPLLSDVVPRPLGRATAPHPAYVAWQHESETPISRAVMGEKLQTRPEGLYRLKGFVLTDDGGYEVHIVGRYVSARRAKTDRTALVGLGPADMITSNAIETWWSE